MSAYCKLWIVSIFYAVGSFSTLGLAEAPKQTPAMLAEGKKNYLTYCVSCHGTEGKGDGPAADSLNPKPRNFSKEQFKFGTKPEEVFKTLSNGSPGTAMAPFTSLSEKDRWSLVYYVLSLKGKK